MRLVFRQFYPDVWEAQAFLRDAPLEHLGSTIAPAEREDLHVAWLTRT